MKVVIMIAFIMIMVVLTGPAKGFTYDVKELQDDESLKNMYERWASEHGVVRNPEEKEERFGAFKDTAHYVHNFNQKDDQPYKMGLNQFSDWTASELSDTHCCLGPDDEVEDTSIGYDHAEAATDVSLPNEVDWRKNGAVTSVKLNYKCSSCWAFATVAAVEGITYIRTNKLMSLSAQELVDCDTGNWKCKGGYAWKAFRFIKENGIATDKSYPYRDDDKQKCNFNKKNSPAAWIDGYYRVHPNREDLMMKVVAKQPVTAEIDSSCFDFRHYSNGVFTGNCGTEFDHIVTIVGYGTHVDGTKYWLVKNSWGSNWGEDGYIKMLRRSNVNDKHTPGVCGIAARVYYPFKIISPQKDEL
ncbi:hypothetical protein ABFS82_14G126500 [Erythranthe guttata]